MGEPARKYISFEQYLAEEELSEEKHEYIDGVALAMSGGTIRHSGLKLRLTANFEAQLQGRPCRPFDSDARVRVLATGLATYPDMSVVCGRIQTDPANKHTLTNPILVAEVLSPKTERYDRGEKFAQYRKIPSLQHSLLLPTSTPRIEHYQRDANGNWTLRTAGPRETLTIADLGVTLDVDKLYAPVPGVDDEFDDESEET